MYEWEKKIYLICKNYSKILDNEYKIYTLMNMLWTTSVNMWQYVTKLDNWQCVHTGSIIPSLELSYPILLSCTAGDEETN